MAELPTWVAPGATVYELQCSARDYKTKKTSRSVVASVTDDWIVLENSARYRVSEVTTTNKGIHYYRDDSVSRNRRNRYFLLVGPDDERVTHLTGQE